MEDFIKSNAEMLNFWFGVANLAAIGFAIYTYKKHRSHVRWEKSIEYGHEGMKCLKMLNVSFDELFGQVLDVKKIDNALEEVQTIESFNIDPGVKEIYKRVRTYNHHKIHIQKDVVNVLIDILCIGVKTRDTQLIEYSSEFSRLVSDLLELNNQINKKCQDFVLGKLKSPDEIFDLDKRFPKNSIDLDSDLNEIFKLYKNLEIAYFKLMRN